MNDIANIIVAIFTLVAIFCATIGLYLYFINTRKIIPTKRGAYLKAVYFSLALVFLTIAFEIKVQTLLCIFISPALFLMIWFEYLINLPYVE